MPVVRRIFAAVIVLALLSAVAAPVAGACCVSKRKTAVMTAPLMNCCGSHCQMTRDVTPQQTTVAQQPSWSAVAPATALDFEIQSADYRQRSPRLQSSPPHPRLNSPLLI